MEFTPKIKFSNPGKFSWFNLMKHLFRQRKGGEGERGGGGIEKREGRRRDRKERGGG